MATTTPSPSLFDLFLSTASQRFEYTCSVIGPNTPIIATSSSANDRSEIHLQRMPRSVTSGAKDFFSLYKQQELSSSSLRDKNKLNLVIEKLLDETIEKLLPDGSRIFQAFVSSLVMEMANENRFLRGALFSSKNANRFKISDKLNEIQDELLLLLLQVTSENPSSSNSDHRLQKCLMRIASMETDSGNNNSQLAQITTSLALNMFSLNDGNCNRNNKKLSSPALISELVGFPLSNSRVLPAGVFLLTMPNDFHNNLAVQSLITNNNSSVSSILLVKCFDFVNFGNVEDESTDDDSSNTDESENDDDDSIQIPKSISDIVQLYRQEINLSDTKSNRRRRDRNSDDWLDQLLSFCQSLVTTSMSSSSDSGNVVILCRQQLPEAARCINEGTVTFKTGNPTRRLFLLDRVDKEIFEMIQQISGGKHFGVRVPFRADANDLPLRNCLVQAEKFCHVPQQHLFQGSDTKTVFEIKIAVDQSNAPRASILCAPSLSIIRDVKRTTMKLIKCCNMDNESENFSFKSTSIFHRLLQFSKNLRNIKVHQDDVMKSAIFECFANAAHQTVVGMLLSSSSSIKSTTSALFKSRTSTQLRLLRDPAKLKNICFEGGSWKPVFEDDDDQENEKTSCCEFDWVLKNVLIASIEFIALMLRSEVYSG